MRSAPSRRVVRSLRENKLATVDIRRGAHYNSNRRFETVGFDGGGCALRGGARGGSSRRCEGVKRIEGVTERLLAAAREEFLEKGYEAASLRAIAERAGSSKGAIYVRYADKEALYAAVVDPVIEELCLFFTEEFDGFGKLPADVQQSTMNDYADQGIGLMMDYIYDHLAEFKILVTNGGERYDEFMHRVVELNSATTYRYIEAVGSDAVTAGRLTPELMHMISSACFSGIFEAVAHDMGRDEAKAYVERLCLFFRAGWQAIFDPQFAALVDLAAQMPDAPVQDVAARLVEARGGAP
ncbi:TetR/AcrR family transcriptional regulator [Eggerthella lenta]|uniref:TetR family transcriptional regulator n=1 Tax=Eggerthella lenta TaxID=84112 RepID=A0A369MY73_EGGLN|nr:TetR family transcriptional regulator [Eggerthella lenta]MVN31183.1 TetR family transcriptional regulator [Eggerthella lenta]MVN34272.1 TetR family transcriptional regulator [Eggerthella lenta]MVN37098.1 TetR family transcriptional regulator [Eggerthella lenta]MVN48432.1 TetR family transcriptional regulator [Eggerthella lenta]